MSEAGRQKDGTGPLWMKPVRKLRPTDEAAALTDSTDRGRPRGRRPPVTRSPAAGTPSE